MAELWFVGAGLGDERDLSERALEVLRSCHAVFAEEYTSILAPGALSRLAVAIGRPVRRLGRAELESEQTLISALAKGERVALVVTGDPFFATTHVALRLAAERAGHSWRYLPNASVFTAVAGFLGLSPYRFGRTVSLPFPDPEFLPTSPIELVGQNRERELHTLLLLDLRPAEGRFLTAHDAIAILSERDRERSVFVSELPIAVVARAGTEQTAAWFGRLDRLARVDFGPPLHSLVVPAARLHFEESAALERFEVR